MELLHYDLPPRLVFADVETTGFHSRDRVVSIGVVELATEGLREHRVEADCTHLIFDPGKKSHPQAEQVHGYDDWTLRHQDVFSIHAPELAEKFRDSTVVWAHNAQFDHAFTEREFLESGFPAIGSFNCTMQLFRAEHPGERASLKAILQAMGIARAREDRHGALEDAWLAMLVYLNLRGMDLREVPAKALVPPTNLRAPPPLSGPLPRRSRKRQPEVVSVAAGEARPTASHTAEVVSLSRPLAT